ncbi:ABC transporter permease [Anopheles sinensis]|uniref:ABC transporter permease n=1 Tax=Anopheles sinensis TaxID=74873 RepID=A0A084WGY4_ANOSI|nr:ABC transporter permease [Anopheles sinensis]
MHFEPFRAALDREPWFSGSVAAIIDRNRRRPSRRPQRSPAPVRSEVELETRDNTYHTVKTIVKRSENKMFNDEDDKRWVVLAESTYENAFKR